MYHSQIWVMDKCQALQGRGSGTLAGCLLQVHGHPLGIRHLGRSY